MSELFAIWSPVLICSAIGYIWARTGTAYPSDFVARAVMNIGAPCLVVSSLNKTAVDLDLIADVALSALLVLSSMALLGWGLLKLQGRAVATYLPSLLFPNCGNMGLPLCLFAFGEQGLALALGYFLVMMIGHFTVGLMIVSSGEKSVIEQLVGLFRMPLTYAMVAGVCILLSGWKLPLWLDNTTSLLAGFTIPLMMITLGVSLSHLHIRALGSSFGYASARIFGGLLIGWLASEWFNLTGVARGVVLLQSAMPVAVFNYLLAEKYRREPTEVAGMVVVSTLMSFALIPLLLAYML